MTQEYKPHPSQAEIRQHLRYCEETGKLFWLHRRQGRRFDKPAGNLELDGYRRICIDGERYMAHRLTWIYHNGDIPEGLQIDHIDHNKDNNSIENLRTATEAENQANRVFESNPYGRGVELSGNFFRAKIGVNGRSIKLGTFEKVEEAQITYAQAAARHHAKFACLS
ncbi:HNH endonuclease signature motif containing protein [Cereibacter changlensis]|uniref:HNH endonuclease signature motif containing protein n=1 Tax=Cereibacter changlensis TaxID=402884 RepID=UPI0040334417